MRHPEYKYLDLMEEILENGDERVDRTGVGTRAIFGASLRFDLSQGQFPILTTKRVFWKTAVKEMLWFLTGDTNIQSLLKENVRIWTDWPLDSYRRATGDPITQLQFEERVISDDEFAQKWGELGPVYGKQWRRWLGADGKEYDQVSSVLETLKKNPTSRRILFHGWNVPEIGSMALPPCHMVYQYFLSSDNKLSCILYQRSCDLLLGAPFNFVGAVALQSMIAQQIGSALGDFIWFSGDTHLYQNHFEQAKIQLSREPRVWPTLRLMRQASSIDDFRIEDFVVEGYAPHDAIKADVAV